MSEAIFMKGRLILNLKYIKEKVRILKKYYPGYSALELLHQFKVVTSCFDDILGTDLPEGCYFKIGNTKYVLIDPNLSDEDKKRVYTHELGHVLLHPDINTLEVEKYDPILYEKLEKEADTFVAEFLLDDDVFMKYFTGCNYKIANHEKIPVRYVNIKVNNLDKSVKKHYEQLFATNSHYVSY